MKVKITTESGSVYYLDKSKMKWERKFNPASIAVRTTSGDMWQWPVVKIGESLPIFGTPLTTGTDIRVVYTSTVMSIEYVCCTCGKEYLLEKSQAPVYKLPPEDILLDDLRDRFCSDECFMAEIDKQDTAVEAFDKLDSDATGFKV